MTRLFSKFAFASRLFLWVLSILLITAVLVATVIGIGWHPAFTSAAGAATAALIALATGLTLLFEFRRGFAYMLRRKLKADVLGHFEATYSILSERLAYAKRVDRTDLTYAVLVIADAWPSPSAIGWSQISDSDPAIEKDLRNKLDRTVRLMETLPTGKQIYWRHLYSAWEILSREISKEALGKGYVTIQWEDAADDWRICLIALQESLRQHPLGQGPSDLPVVTLLERLRKLSANGELFKPAERGDLAHIHLQGFIDGPYLLVSDPMIIDKLPTIETPYDPPIEGIVPLYYVKLEDKDGERKDVKVVGSRWSISPNPSLQGTALAKFDTSRWRSEGPYHAVELDSPPPTTTT